MKELGRHEKAKRLALEKARELRGRELAEKEAQQIDFPESGEGWKLVRENRLWTENTTS